MTQSSRFRPTIWFWAISIGQILSTGIVAAQPLNAGHLAPHVFEQNVQPFLKLECHGGSQPEAGLRLDTLRDPASVESDRPTWQRVLRMLRSGQMPPEEKPRPPKPDVEIVAQWIERSPNGHPRVSPRSTVDPGRVTIRRLNRAEYANTIRDLLGVQFDAVEELPADDVGYGFDNIGDVLSLPPVLMEKYLAAAERIVRQAVQSPQSRHKIFPADFSEKPSTESARQILKRFATRAFRRPMTDRELDRLVRLIDRAIQEGARFEESVQLAIQAILVSPNFLFRVEVDPAGSLQAVRLLNEYEFATCMSYFLWSSMPDDELFVQAARGSLRRNASSQALRMLKDPKSRCARGEFRRPMAATAKHRQHPPGQSPVPRVRRESPPSDAN